MKVIQKIKLKHIIHPWICARNSKQSSICQYTAINSLAFTTNSDVHHLNARKKENYNLQTQKISQLHRKDIPVFNKLPDNFRQLTAKKN